MGAMDDLTKQAKGFVEQHKEQIDAALHSQQAEDVSDTVLDAVAEQIDKVTGGKHTDAIHKARTKADGAIGTE